MPDAIRPSGSNDQAERLLCFGDPIEHADRVVVPVGIRKRHSIRLGGGGGGRGGGGCGWGSLEFHSDMPVGWLIITTDGVEVAVAPPARSEFTARLAGLPVGALTRRIAALMRHRRRAAG